MSASPSVDTGGRYQWAVQAPDGRVFSRVDHEDALKYLPDGWSVVRRPIDVGWEVVASPSGQVRAMTQTVDTEALILAVCDAIDDIPMCHLGDGMHVTLVALEAIAGWVSTHLDSRLPWEDYADESTLTRPLFQHVGVSRNGSKKAP